MITAAEAALDTRPQHTPGLTRLGRRYVARHHARQSIRSIKAHLATSPGLPKGVDLVSEANRQLGKSYSASISCRCSDACRCQDCSGLVSGARNAVTAPFGFPPICMSSFGFGPMCRAAGRLVTEDYAIHTPGCIGIENAWGSSNGPLGTNGHIVIFVGDGETTIEEMGTRNGCCHGPATGRNFNAWAQLPDIDYTPQATFTEAEMQTFICPNKPMKNGHTPRADFYPAGTNPIWPHGALLMHDGASISGDQKTADPNVRLLLPGVGRSWLACTARPSNKGLMTVNDQGVPSAPDANLWS